MRERDDARSTDGEGGNAENEADPEEAGTDPDDDADHLDGVEDGAGCTEIWERLSERREE
ncbi:hypothetical protein C463_15755 [Halorubrum californiense DSM 19288]|uniref:Uncharacterized protein n=1 Tax=Halorubrum californiense DSM 19288 TaxID=1227465 RepID=M0E013_9EURY|nr:MULTISPECIES: hypothetical protein [Halorubrum]ELZ40388.1 hypothetical protein C463_15755 [Halorubrum californiense DSM 19288]TKX73302.1 hypothetical protein EXE40_00820 [Halorubrum sp. GN11GM_10-3_MGM]